MTKEQEVFEKVNRIRIDFFDRKYKDVHTDDEIEEKYEALGDILNMLKEKDKEIEELKQALARNIAKNFTSSMKESEKSKEDLEMLNKGWQIELEKKDKIIDLMSEWLCEDDTSFRYGKLKDINTSEKIKQYFERKATNNG